MNAIKASFLEAYTVLLFSLAATHARAATNDWFGIRVVDDVTGRGVPLVELETVNQIRFVTDSAGWAAIREPDWDGRSIFFTIRSHGYQFAKDGFGMAGTAIDVKGGGRTTLRIHRINIAERLYRVTGEGIYRDSLLLGQPAPLEKPLLNAQVAGQDSANVAIYHDQLYWFWGDTLRMRYPLGLFHTSGARSDLPGRGGLAPDKGVNLTYRADKDGFSRGMCPLDGTQSPYLVWIDGVISVMDAQGRQRMAAHYEKLKSLGHRLEHGLAVWDDKKEIFEPALKLPSEETWRFLRGHPLRQTLDGHDYFLCGDNFPDVRVPARFEDVIKPDAYEAYTCFAARQRSETPEASRGADGKLDYRWSHEFRPANQNDEERWLKSSAIKESEARLLPADVDSKKRIHFHNGSTCWNSYRKRWICIAVEQGGSSYLGEVWYAESSSPTGPWLKAKKILTHDRYSFYNPVQHDFFDQQDGRVIYFEGTYATTFSGNSNATPRYDYNQIMHCLDLGDPRIAAAFAQ